MPVPARSRLSRLPLRAAAIVIEVAAVQALASMAVIALPTIAPIVAADLQVDPSLVGYQISLIYAAAMLMSLKAGDFVPRLGPERASQVALLLAALGLYGVTTGYLWGMVLGSLVMGAAYGMTNPAASEILARNTDPKHRNLIFSIKQTGVPAGVMLAGVLIPLLAQRATWPIALLSIALTCLALAAVSSAARLSRGGPTRKPATGPAPRISAFGLIWRSKAIRSLAAASSCFAGAQLCAMAFMVTALVQEAGASVAAAARVLIVVQVGGMVGRIAWGWLADRTQRGPMILLSLGLGMAVSCILFALSIGFASWAATVLAGLALGLTVVAWNGVYLAQVSKMTRPDELAAATGGAIFASFLGVMIVPFLFVQVYAAVGSYRATFVALAAVCLAGALLVARSLSHAGREAEAAGQPDAPPVQPAS